MKSLCIIKNNNITYDFIYNYVSVDNNSSGWKGDHSADYTI